MEKYIYAKVAVDTKTTNKTEEELTEEWTNFYYKYGIINRLTQNVANGTIIELERNKDCITGLAKGLYRDFKKRMLHISIEEANISHDEALLEAVDDKVDGYTAQLKTRDEAVVSTIVNNIAECGYKNTYIVARILASILEIGSYWNTLTPLIDGLHCRKAFKQGIVSTHGTAISDPYRMLRKLWFTITERMPCRKPHSINIDYHIYNMTIPDLPGLRDAVKTYIDAANAIVANDNIQYGKTS